VKERRPGNMACNNKTDALAQALACGCLLFDGQHERM